MKLRMAFSMGGPDGRSGAAAAGCLRGSAVYETQAAGNDRRRYRKLLVEMAPGIKVSGQIDDAGIRSDIFFRRGGRRPSGPFMPHCNEKGYRVCGPCKPAFGRRSSGEAGKPARSLAPSSC